MAKNGSGKYITVPYTYVHFLCLPHAPPTIWSSKDGLTSIFFQLKKRHNYHAASTPASVSKLHPKHVPVYYSACHAVQRARDCKLLLSCSLSSCRHTQHLSIYSVQMFHLVQQPVEGSTHTNLQNMQVLNTLKHWCRNQPPSPPTLPNRIPEEKKE